jgi:transposase
MRKPKQQHRPLKDMKRCLTPLDPNRTLNRRYELSQKTWLVAGIIPGVERQPLKKLAADEKELIKLLERWRTGVFSVRARNRLAKALSFWKSRKRRASWTMPHRMKSTLTRLARWRGARGYRPPSCAMKKRSLRNA